MKSSKKYSVLVLMAGAGQRFVDAGYTTSKPLIEVDGKTILEWTMSSLPFIQDCHLTFAIRSHHNANGELEAFLKNTYGADTDIVSFDELTRGNLETAWLSLESIPDNESLFILDSDNWYNGVHFEDFIAKIPEKDYAVLCTFDPIDDQEKWCFAQTDENHIVHCLSEKKKIDNGYPMMGLFYYSNKELFKKAAQEILNKGTRVKNEFYMSQSIVHLIDSGIPVYAYKAPSVVPLGTPEDLDKAKNENLLRPRRDHMLHTEAGTILFRS